MLSTFSFFFSFFLKWALGFDFLKNARLKNILSFLFMYSHACVSVFIFQTIWSSYLLTEKNCIFSTGHSFSQPDLWHAALLFLELRAHMEWESMNSSFDHPFNWKESVLYTSPVSDYRNSAFSPLRARDLLWQ